MKYSNLILPVKTRSATELIKHRHGVGERYVFADHNNNPTGNIYAIIRTVENVDKPDPHVDKHAHDVDSLWMFLGDNKDLTGLQVFVILGDEKHTLDSPASIYVPAGVQHTYGFVKGSGKYINIVLAPGGKYNENIK